MIVNTPPMGWNSWNTFATDISEDLIKETADRMVSEGLLDCGYNYLVIDDCWSLKERDENGRIVPDPAKFPNGMKAVADYVHSKGLKFGMYSCAGMLTCAGYPASFEHEHVDAATFAEWGVDFLKYDYCYKPGSVCGEVLYRRMGAALANCGRDILFSACSWGADNTKDWVQTTGAHMWRSTGDIFDSWESLKKLSLAAVDSVKQSKKNCYFDMDMLIVGMYGKGNVGLAGCTDEEYRMHFSLWALLGTPLMIGCDIRNMTPFTKEILTNKEVIAINQDTAYNQPYQLRINDEQFIWVKFLENGDYAIGFFNFADYDTNPMVFHLKLDEIGLSEATGKTIVMRDLWTGEEKKVTNGVYSSKMPAHTCRLFRAKVVDR